MAIRIDDGTVMRMIVARLAAELGAEYTVRYMADAVNDAENSPLVTIDKMTLSDLPRSQTDDEHRASLNIVIVGSIGSEQESSNAIGTVGAAISAALADVSLVDGVDLGGSSSEHIVTFRGVTREYSMVSLEDREVAMVQCSFDDAVALRQSGSSIASFLN